MSSSSAPKGLTWPRFVSWYSTQNKPINRRSAAWKQYREKFGVKSSTRRSSSVRRTSQVRTRSPTTRTPKKSGYTTKSRPVDQDEWDEMGRSLNLINNALKSAKKNKTTKSSVLKQHKSTPDSPTKPWYKSNSKLTHRQRKYCDCVIEIENVNNPWAACAKSTGTSYHTCGQEYNWRALPRQQLYNYAKHAKKPSISVSASDSKETLLKKIDSWKQKKYGEHI